MNKHIGLGLFFFYITVILFAGGGKEKNANMEMEQISQSIEHAEAVMETGTAAEVTGIVRLIGSGPAPELVITGLNGEWYIDREEEYKLKDLQQQTVTVIGEETIKALKFANGLSAGERRTLKNITIIAAQ